MKSHGIQKKNEDILDLEQRRNIYLLVSKYPGSHIRELERKSHIPYSTLKYHLHYLLKHNLLKEQKGNGTLQYYPTSISNEEIEILSQLRHKTNRKILLSLLTHKKSTLAEFEQTLKLSPATILWYLERLQHKHLIRKNTTGKKTVYFLIYDTNKLMKTLITYKESFVDALVEKTIAMWEIR